MPKYRYGTYFYDKDKTKKVLTIFDYDGDDQLYSCKCLDDGEHYRYSRTEEEITECLNETFNLNAMTIEQLQSLQAEVARQLENRRDEAKRKAWQKVVSAVEEYVEEYGNIIVEIYNGNECRTEEIELDESVYSFSDVGKIFV